MLLMKTACVSLLSAGVLAAGLLVATAAQAAAVSASGLLGARVVNPQGERLGDIRDLAVDIGSGSVTYVILEAAETSRLPRKLSAVPVAALQPGLGRDQLVVDTSAGAPWRERLPAPAEGNDMMRAKAILGMPIEHPSGAEYGVIDDLVVELETGRVLNARVSLDAAPENVKREVPFAALRFPPGARNALITLAEGHRQ